MKNGQDDPLIPSELDVILGVFREEAERNAIRKAYYGFSHGDPKTFSVSFSVLLAACTKAMKTFPEANRKVMEAEGKKIIAELLAIQTETKQWTVEVRRSAETCGREVGAVSLAVKEELEKDRKSLQQEISEFRRVVLSGKLNATERGKLVRLR